MPHTKAACVDKVSRELAATMEACLKSKGWDESLLARHIGMPLSVVKEHLKLWKENDLSKTRSRDIAILFSPFGEISLKFEART